MLFQDPDGIRILYDAGRTVAGADHLFDGGEQALLRSVRDWLEEL